MNARLNFHLPAFALAVSLSSAAHARSWRTGQIPSGSTVGCAACHNNPSGGGSRTAFGEAVWAALPAANKGTTAAFWSAALASRTRMAMASAMARNWATPRARAPPPRARFPPTRAMPRPPSPARPPHPPRKACRFPTRRRPPTAKAIHSRSRWSRHRHGSRSPAPDGSAAPHRQARPDRTRSPSASRIRPRPRSVIPAHRPSSRSPSPWPPHRL